MAESERPEELVEAAEQAHEAGDLETALALWKKLILSPVYMEGHGPVAYLKSGRLAQKLERWQEAEEAYSEALKINPEAGITHGLMGSLWAERMDKGKAEALETAKSWFLRVMELKPTAYWSTLLGAVYVDLDDKVAATKSFEEALRLDGNYEEAMYNLATMYTKSKPTEAIQLLERAIEIDPSYALAHQALGKLIQRSGNFPRAESHFRRCLDINQADYFSVLFLANALGVQRKNKEAQQRYEDAIAMEPTLEGGFRFYSNFLDSIGKHEKAITIRNAAPKEEV